MQVADEGLWLCLRLRKCRPPGEAHDERAAFHSITSSALARRAGAGDIAADSTNAATIDRRIIRPTHM